MVQAEPWLPRDKAMIDQLRLIGIEKGKSFKPNKKTNKLLRSAAAEAHAWLESQYETVFAAPPFYQGTQWAVPVLPEVIDGMCTGFANTDQYPTDGRGLLYSFAFFCAKHLGAGQFYVMTIKDRKGQDFDGSKTYRLTVPANAPVKQYWSATIYDRENHALIRNRPWSRPIFADTRNPEERRRICRHLFRTESTGVQEIKLGSHTSGRKIRSAVPHLRTRKIFLREDVGVAGSRENPRRVTVKAHLAGPAIAPPGQEGWTRH